jgi:hypothetical protein
MFSPSAVQRFRRCDRSEGQEAVTGFVGQDDFHDLVAIGAPGEDGCMNSGPPLTWREHWFEHDQLLYLAAATSQVAVYFDPDVNDDAGRWLLPYLDEAWHYTKQTFGEFGPDPLLYSIFHQGRYAGGHPSSYQDPSHDNRNVTDCGPGPYREGDSGIPEMVTHEISHVVEGANNGAWGSPAFPIWGDSKWAELFIYDVYTALGRHRWAADVAKVFDRNSDAFPRRDTHWAGAIRVLPLASITAAARSDRWTLADADRSDAEMTSIGLNRGGRRSSRCVSTCRTGRRRS